MRHDEQIAGVVGRVFDTLSDVGPHAVDALVKLTPGFATRRLVVGVEDVGPNVVVRHAANVTVIALLQIGT